MAQAAIDLRADRHLDQVIVDVPVDHSLLSQFKSLTGMDIALNIPVDRCVRDFDFARHPTTRDNPQYRIFGRSLNRAHHRPFNIQLPGESDVTLYGGIRRN
jgi:hypothetical protein